MYFIAELFHLPQANFIEKTTCRNKSFFLEAPPRIELGVKALQARALPLGHGALLKETQVNASQNGAEDGIRTRDVHLGKVTLYH